MTAPADREARLAAALRANLHRRKAQARGRRAAQAEGGHAEGGKASPDGRATQEEARPAHPDDRASPKDP